MSPLFSHNEVNQEHCMLWRI